MGAGIAQVRLSKIKKDYLINWF